MYHNGNETTVLDFNAYSDNMYLNVHSNTEWFCNTDPADMWLEAIPSYGSDDGSVIVFVTDNDTTNTRSAILEFWKMDVSNTKVLASAITITQAPGYEFGVVPVNVTFKPEPNFRAL